MEKKMNYNFIMQWSSKYSLGIILVMMLITAVYLIDELYVTNLLLSLNVVYTLNKFLNKRLITEINIDKLKLEYNMIQEFILYYTFIIFISSLIIITTFITDLFILTDNIKSSYITLIFFSLYSFNKIIHRYEQ